MLGEDDQQSKLKSDILLKELSNYGYQKENRISQSELLLFLNRKSPIGKFDEMLSEKLFNILNMDKTTTISIEEFIYGYLQLEEELKRNFEFIHSQYLEQEKVYNDIVDLCQKYQSEKYNEQGFCEEGKFYGEIIDIKMKNHLEIAKDIILKLIYGGKQIEIKREYSQDDNILVNQPFEFRAVSKNENFHLVLQADSGYGYLYDLGTKSYSLKGIENQDEFFVRIEIPEVICQGENQDRKLKSAEINAKIAMLWSKFQLHEAQRIKEEPKLNKLRTDDEEAEEILKKVQYIYGDINKYLEDLNEQKEKDVNDLHKSQKSDNNSEKMDNNDKMYVFTSKKYAVEFNNMRIDEVLKKGKKISYNYNTGLSSSKKNQNSNIKQSQSINDFKDNSRNENFENSMQRDNLENLKQNENAGLNINISHDQNIEDIQQNENDKKITKFEDLEEKESIDVNEKDENSMKNDNSENLHKNEENEQKIEKKSINMLDNKLPNDSNINKSQNNLNMDGNIIQKSNISNNSNQFNNNSNLQKSNEFPTQSNTFPNQNITQNTNLINNSNMIQNSNVFPNQNIIGDTNKIGQSNEFPNQSNQIITQNSIVQKPDITNSQNMAHNPNIIQNPNINNSNLPQYSNIIKINNQNQGSISQDNNENIIMNIHEKEPTFQRPIQVNEGKKITTFSTIPNYQNNNILGLSQTNQYNSPILSYQGYSSNNQIYQF